MKNGKQQQKIPGVFVCPGLRASHCSALAGLELLPQLPEALGLLPAPWYVPPTLAPNSKSLQFLMCPRDFCAMHCCWVHKPKPRILCLLPWPPFTFPFSFMPMLTFIENIFLLLPGTQIRSEDRWGRAALEPDSWVLPCWVWICEWKACSLLWCAHCEPSPHYCPILLLMISAGGRGFLNESNLSSF